MKSSTNVKSKIAAAILMVHSTCFYSCAQTTGENTTNAQPAVSQTQTTPDGKKKKIKIALLLDTSNSMDGLINQAKSQLWKLVNQLAIAKCDNEKPNLEIALYEYGNTGLESSKGYIRQVSAFTGDLDLISEKLFSLTTNGGDEYCGQVIYTSLNDLNWKGDDGDLRLIFIAGNEPFTQGSVSYKTACANAKEKDVIVNTIFCGDFNEGINTGWKNGAALTGGEYMSIEQNRQTVYIESPYDKEISDLNNKLNDTYVSYGYNGKVKKENQIVQDKNAESYGSANKAERIKSKTSTFYSNKSWDLVDAAKEKNFTVTTIKEDELPEELKGKSAEEKQKYIAQKSQERENVKTQIVELNKKRMVYIIEKEKTMQVDEKSLDAVMVKSIKGQAAKKKFVFENGN